jgi:2-succinyl-6-hydroxy-2,4-cyclohexadiene-1-carboxylate synthase
MSVETRRIAAGCVGLHVTLRGSGRPLLLLHGFTGGGDSLGHVVDRFALAQRTIAPDLVGHGRSDAPDSLRLYSMEACTAQLVAVLDALEIERVDVFGYSMGGRAALALCAGHPERVRRAVVLGASAGLATPAERAERVARDTALADRIERDGVAAFARAWAEIPLFASQQRRLTPTQRAAAQRVRETNTATGLAHSLRGMGTGAQPPLHEVLPAISIPVLCLAGDEDAKFRALAEALARALPHGAAAVIPDAGHAAHLENPDATAALTLGFLEAPLADVEREIASRSATPRFAEPS